MPGLTRPLLALALLLPACGPDKEDTSDSSSATTTAETTAGPSGSTTDNPTSSTTAETGGTTDASAGTTSENLTTSTTAETGNTTDEDPCDPFPEEGQPCTADGTYCNTGCEDQCQFCNILMCSEGTWNNLEAPPAPCLECQELCPFTVMPMCAAGPPDEAACVTGCMDVMTGPCSVEFSATRACAGFEPTFSCDAAERPTIAGCEMQFDALYTCLGI